MKRKHKWDRFFLQVDEHTTQQFLFPLLRRPPLHHCLFLNCVKLVRYGAVLEGQLIRDMRKHPNLKKLLPNACGQLPGHNQPWLGVVTNPINPFGSWRKRLLEKQEEEEEEERKKKKRQKEKKRTCKTVQHAIVFATPNLRYHWHMSPELVRKLLELLWWRLWTRKSQGRERNRRTFECFCHIHQAAPSWLVSHTTRACDQLLPLRVPCASRAAVLEGRWSTRHWHSLEKSRALSSACPPPQASATSPGTLRNQSSPCDSLCQSHLQKLSNRKRTKNSVQRTINKERKMGR